MGLAEDLSATLYWLDDEHQAARAECERLLTVRPPATGTAAGVREAMRHTVDVAVATARLETWNELRQGIIREARKVGLL